MFSGAPAPGIIQDPVRGRDLTSSVDANGLDPGNGSLCPKIAVIMKIERSQCADHEPQVMIDASYR